MDLEDSLGEARRQGYVAGRGCLTFPECMANPYTVLMFRDEWYDGRNAAVEVTRALQKPPYVGTYYP